MPARMEPILAKPFKVQDFLDTAGSWREPVGREMAKDFSATIKTWDRQPVVQIHLLPNGVLTLIQNEIYFILNHGAKPHPIPKIPKTEGWLRFQPGYTAKTTPGVIGSKPGGSFGAFIKKKQVHHPGVEARLWDKAIADKWRVLLPKFIGVELHKAVKQSGHEM